MVLDEGHDGLEIVGDEGAVLLGVDDDLLLGLLEGQFLALVVLPEVLGEGHAGLDLLTGVPLDHLDDLIHHLLLEHQRGVQYVYVIRKPIVHRVTPRGIGVEPDLHLPITVDADQVLPGLEVPHKVEDLLEPVKGTEQDVQVLGVGDVLEVAEADGDVFDVDECVVGGVAELAALFDCDELGVDYVVLPLSPLEELQVLLVLLGVVESNGVLFDLLVGQVVAV